MRPSLGTDIAAPAEMAWQELTQLRNWPQWGPTVRGARLDDGSGSVFPGASGSVQTTGGLWLPFLISGWEDSGSRRTWSWRVAGIPATTHTVLEKGASRCRVEMSVPLLAPAYLGVVAIALRRIKTRLETAPRPA